MTRAGVVVLLLAGLAVPAPAQQSGSEPHTQPQTPPEVGPAVTPRAGSLLDLSPADVLEAARQQTEELLMPMSADIDAAMARGLDFLLAEQRENGSYGGWEQPGPYDDFWSNPYSHYGWIAATTGLVAMTLLEQPETPAVRGALDRSLRYLLDVEVPKRPSDWDTDNTWGLVYGLEGMASALADPRYADGPLTGSLRAKVSEYVERLAAYQTPSGGWGYYDFEALTSRPSWATSFMTAAAVVALEKTRRLHLEFPDDVTAAMHDGGIEGMLAAAVRGLERCRLPNGAYDYSIDAIPTPGRLEGINNLKGSLGRIQAGNYALTFAGSDAVSHEELLAGLDRFFEHHRFLDVARQQPIPHEAYYANAGYFYYFGHYYAARVLELLPPAERVRYQARLAREIIKTQESDGSMWDYYMQSYHRPYGTAFGVMTLMATLPDDLR